METKKIGMYSEMHMYADNGSIKDNIVKKIDYDKTKLIKYLEKGQRIASCPRAAIDCNTKKQIEKYFAIYTDGEYEWPDFLIYHIRKYNLSMPEDLLIKAKAK